MRGNTHLKYLIIFILLFSLGFLFEGVSADTAKVEILGEPTYECYKVTSSGYYYHINVTFYNSGSENSDSIDIEILENNKVACSSEESTGVIFQPNERKTFTFNWSTVSKSKTLEIVYNPSSPNIQSITGVNSGSKLININYDVDNNENVTPGFEFLFVIISIIFYIIIFIFSKKK
jgi:hypothetical protein